jgi:hypothetical protein
MCVIVLNVSGLNAPSKSKLISKIPAVLCTADTSKT